MAQKDKKIKIDEAANAETKSQGEMVPNFLDAIVQMNSEIMNFVSQRIEEDMKTQQDLLNCDSIEDLQKAQLAFLEKAYVHYTVETGKLIKMGMKMLPQTPAMTKHTPL